MVDPLIPTTHRSHSPFTAGTRLTTQIIQETLDHVQTISIANVERAHPFLLKWVASEIKTSSRVNRRPGHTSNG